MAAHYIGGASQFRTRPRVLDGATGTEPLRRGVNCAPWGELAACLPVLRASGLPFVAYANLGAPLSAGAFAHDLSPLEFVAAAARWRDANAAWIGGCCGTTPAQVAAIASLP